MENGTTLFSAGLENKGHIFVCLHGAGYSGGQNLGSGIGTTVPITLLQATSYTAPSDMILHKMQSFFCFYVIVGNKCTSTKT